MTHGLRTWRALGVGLGLVIGGLSGCTHSDGKKVTSPPPSPNRQIGPTTAGGGVTRPGTTQPTGTSATGSTYNRTATPPGTPGGVTPASGSYPSVQPGATTSSSFGSPSPLDTGAVPQRNYMPGMGVSPSPAGNPASMQLFSPPAGQSQSMGSLPPYEKMADSRSGMTGTTTAMAGTGSIPMSVAGLPSGPSLDPLPPMPPAGVGATGAAGRVQPPENSFGPIAPTRPAGTFGGQ